MVSDLRRGIVSARKYIDGAQSLLHSVKARLAKQVCVCVQSCNKETWIGNRFQYFLILSFVLRQGFLELESEIDSGLRLLAPFVAEALVSDCFQHVED